MSLVIWCILIVSSGMIFSGSIKDSNELESNKKRLFEKMDKIEDPQIRKEIKKNIENLTNTRYGISGEKDILQFCSETMGRKIVKDDIYRKKKIYTGKMEWYIGGKIFCIDFDLLFLHV